MIIFDDAGHSYWVNTAMLNLLGISCDSKDLTPISRVVRDKDGAPTGWIKEFVATRKLAPYFLRPEPEICERMKGYLENLARDGVTSVFDAGNYGLEDHI